MRNCCATVHVVLSSLPIVFRWQGAKFQTKPSHWKTFEIMRKVAYETSSIVFNLYDNQLYFRLACMLKLLERHSINLLRSKFSSPLFDSCQNYLRDKIIDEFEETPEVWWS